MSQLAKEITEITVEEELKRSYLDYAMSVIVGRALPDVRDGLKPVHRRTLYAMQQLGNDWNKPYKKSARIVGDVIGKYHPHGDTAVYDTIVRMAQTFSMRYVLVDGQGNFGSVDGDAPAAMRYTEIRMSRMAHSLLADLEKETVDYVPNYDESEQIPVVLPTRIPNLLVNGSSGIAVGMATNIPPHNLNEIIDATLALIENPDLEIKDLMQYVPGPDFPTAAIINGRAGILEAYQTGRGRITIRARTEIETDPKTNKATIIVHELPYQVNKAHLLEKIGDLVREKKVEGITELRDESDKDGMRVVIEIRRGDQAEVVLNNLYAHTQLQAVFGINIVALDQGQPRQMNLKQLLHAFIQHRRDVVTRRSLYELRKARERAHILEGLSVALANIDEIIVLIKSAKTPSDAKAALTAKAWKLNEVEEWLKRSDMEKVRPENLEDQYGLHEGLYYLSNEQAQAILDLRLHRLTNMEQGKIHGEYQQLILDVAELFKIISDSKRLHEVICQELLEVKEQFGDARKTEIIDAARDLTIADLITEEDVVVTLSRDGYIKCQSLDSYQAQHRGGRGRMATAVKEEDVIKNIVVAHSHNTILCFSDRGKVYWLKVYQIPQGGPQARGKPIINVLPLEKDEVITAILPLFEMDAEKYIVMATSKGTIKKTSLREFAVPRSNGKIALGLAEEDHLIGVDITDGSKDIMLMADNGKAIRFNEQDVRETGRLARGVRGIRLRAGQAVISLIVLQAGASILTATEKGYGQRTLVDDYRAIGRGGQGVGVIRVNERNGKVIAATQVNEGDEVLLISDHGTMVRTRINEISVLGRNTQGVRLIQVAEGEKLVGIEAIKMPESVESEDEEESHPARE